MVTVKRKAATADEGDVGHTIRRRARKACQSCRARKVRCDVVLNGPSCTNCRLDSLECIVPKRRKCRSDTNKNRSDSGEIRQSPSQSNNKTSAKSGVPVIKTSGEDSYLSPNSTVAEDEIPMCLTFDDRNLIASTNLEHERYDECEGSSVQLSPLSTSLSAFIHTQSTTAALCLPPFIKAFPTNFAQEDLDDLISKGALDLPGQDLRVDILKAYMSGVHVFMPILNMQEVLESVSKNDGQQRISLMVFQAVMFAGLAHLPDDCVRKTGYATLKEARTAYFTRVRLLHDFDAEQDDVAVLQSLLLMSFVYEKWNKRQHTWYWSGIALSHAQSMGLYCGSSTNSLPSTTQSLHRRLWWSLYIRDRLIGLGLRRPIRIKDDDFEVPPLVISDFDTSSFQVDFVTSTGKVSIQQDSAIATLLALFCVELAKLCVCIGHILSTQYTVLGQRTEHTKSMMMAPRPLEQRIDSLSRCCEELRDWYEFLHPHLRPFALYRGDSISKECSEIHWPILHMIYRTSIIVLHRPHMLQRQVGPAKDLQGQALSGERVKAAARTLTSIAQTMHQQGRVRFLPTSGVSALLAASLAHLSTVKSADEDARDASAYRFYQSMQILQELRKVYASADSAVFFLAITVRKSGLNLQTSQKQSQSDVVIPSSMMKQSEAETGFDLEHYPVPSSLATPDATDRTMSDPVSQSAHVLAHDFNCRTSKQPQGSQLNNFTASVLGDNNAPESVDLSPATAHPSAFLSDNSNSNHYAQADTTFRETFPWWLNEDQFLQINELPLMDVTAPLDHDFDYDADTFALWDLKTPN